MQLQCHCANDPQFQTGVFIDVAINISAENWCTNPASLC